MSLTPATRFSGKCPGCDRWTTYRPLPAGRGLRPGVLRGLTPGLPIMNVTCGQCGASVTLAADAGQSTRQPLIIDRDEVDVSKIRAHCKELHGYAATLHLPRSNADASAWHTRQHHRFRIAGHVHLGPWVLVRSSRGITTGQLARPLGWYTGQDVKTSAQLEAEWQERARQLAAGKQHEGRGNEDFSVSLAGNVQRDTDGTITRGPSLPCGCPLDADCTGQHPGRP